MQKSRFIRIGFGCLLLAATTCMSAQAQTDSLAQSQIAEAHPSELQGAQDVVTEESRPVTEVAERTFGALWDEANTAYINANYHKAVEVYESILAQGFASSKLYYNLGNAYFKEGDLGKSILFYNRALRLNPGSEDIRYNLEVALSRTKDNIEAIPEFFAVTWLRALRHTMGCTAWSILSLALLVLMLGLLLLYLLARRISLRKAGFYGTCAALLLCIATTWFAVLERREIRQSDEAIVMVSSSSVKSSPDKASTDLFMLHEGTKVTLADRLDGWCEIVIADGKKGWIEERKIEII